MNKAIKLRKDLESFQATYGFSDGFLLRSNPGFKDGAADSYESRLKQKLRKHLRNFGKRQKNIMHSTPQVKDLRVGEAHFVGGMEGFPSGDAIFAYSLKKHNLYVHSDSEGHGVPAAIDQLLLHEVLWTIVTNFRREPCLEHIVEATNNRRLQCRDHFSTATFYLVDRTKPEISMVQAGSRGFYFDGSEVHEIIRGSRPLGIESISHICSEEFTLEPGQSIHGYSDGVFDLVNPIENEITCLSSSEIRQHIRTSAKSSAWDVCNQIQKQLENLGPGHDDRSAEIFTGLKK